MLHGTPHTFIGTTTFGVAGMTGSGREHGLAREIARLPGVVAVTVDVTSGTVTVTVAEPVDRADIAAVVEDAGCTLIP